MAAKRFSDDSDRDPHKPSDKRIRPNRPSFASVIGEVVMAKNLQNLFSGLEPLLRRVVNEEMELAIRQRCNPARSMSITRSPSLRITALESQASSSLQLMFSKEPSLPIFTNSRIVDGEGNPIHVVLVDKSGDQMVRTSLPHPMKLELVVLDGDFPHPNGDNESWTTEEFNNHIVKERTGKRPLLAGELTLTVRDGVAPIGDIEFTDNSSWIRSRKFRIAVRLPPGTNRTLRVREAITHAFVVKDHRGELYKKHHPPTLNDEVWRLEKIGKDGAFHKKLSSMGITTVQHFLMLYFVDPRKLRHILGVGMSDRMWEATIKHARTCNTGNKLYVYRGPQFIIVLNSICQLIKAEVSGQVFPSRDMTNMNKSYVEKLVREAYDRWNQLEEIDEFLNDKVALLTQGETAEQFANSHPSSAIAYDQNEYHVDLTPEVNDYVAGQSAQVGYNDWAVNATYATASFEGMPYSFSE